MGVLGKALGLFSGENRELKVSENILFDKVIGFKGIVEGVGASTILQNTAIALASKTSLSIGVIDVSFMFPAQYDLLTNADNTDEVEDIIDYTDDISVIMLPSKYRNIRVVGFKNRSIVDMMSTRDSGEQIVKIIEDMKGFFDVILIDLGNEFTQTYAEAAIKCNRIYTVLDPSIKCMSHLQKSINTMASLAIPFYKCRKCLVNKMVDNINAGTMSAIEAMGFNVLDIIPLSAEIASGGIIGSKLWGAVSKGKDITQFNYAIDKVVDDILNGEVQTNENGTAPEVVNEPKINTDKLEEIENIEF